MPQTCSICASERLAEVNKALLVQGRSLRDVSQTFCVAFASLAWLRCALCLRFYIMLPPMPATS